jgi:hypothetical protein
VPELEGRVSGYDRVVDDIARALTAVWVERGIDGATLATADDGTIRPPQLADVTDDDLPLLFVETSTSAAPFVMGETIGSGGMGIVRSAPAVPAP